MKKPSVRISQCMIVKNEENNIEKALSWGRDIVCEQIVVDTGSTDRTVEIAESMGAKVYHFKWIDDFSAAKNHAIEQASGDWIAFLDADEYFTEDDARKLPQLLAEINSDKNVYSVIAKWVHLSGSDVMGVSVQRRLFRNDEHIRYRNRIHEDICHTEGKAIGHYDAQEELAIMHTGYGRETNKPEKGRRNAELLERDLAEQPGNAERLMYLGDAYGMCDEDEKALKCFRTVLWDDTVNNLTEVAFMRAGLQLMTILINRPPQEIREEIEKTCRLLEEKGDKTHPDMDFFRGWLAFNEDKIPEAAQYFAGSLQKAETYKGLEGMRIAGYLELPYYTLSVDAFNKGEMSNAVNYAVATLRAQKYSGGGITVLLKAFMSEYRPGMSAQPYYDFLIKLYDMNNLKDMLFIYRFANETGFVELARIVYDQMPEEVRSQLG